MSVPALDGRPNANMIHWQGLPWVTTETYPWGKVDKFTQEDYACIGFSVRSAVIKGQTVHVGSLPWQLPTSYFRKVVRIHRDRPVVWTRALNTGVIRRTERYLGRAVDDVVFIPGWWNGYTTPVFDSNLANRTDTEALVKLGDCKMQIGVSIAEASKTADMLATNMKTLLYAYRSVRRGNPALAAKHLGISKDMMGNSQTVVSRFLEWRYGWAPLMGEIKSSYDLLHKQLAKPLIVKGYKRVTEDRDFNRSNCRQGTALPDKVEGHIIRGVETCLYGVIRDSLIRSTRQTIGDPLAIAWELIPYSFVVDWVMPVGNTLTALTATAGMDFLAGYRNAWAELRAELQDTADRESSTGEPRTAKIECFFQNREALKAFPVGRLYVKSPFSTLNVATALALFKQAHR